MVASSSHHGHCYTPNLLSAQIAGSGGQEAQLGRAGKAEVLEAPLATPGLQRSAMSFLPGEDGASVRELLSFPVQPQAPHLTGRCR